MWVQPAHCSFGSKAVVRNGCGFPPWARFFLADFFCWICNARLVPCQWISPRDDLCITGRFCGPVLHSTASLCTLLHNDLKDMSEREKIHSLLQSDCAELFLNSVSSQNAITVCWYRIMFGLENFRSLPWRRPLPVTSRSNKHTERGRT